VLLLLVPCFPASQPQTACDDKREPP